jgi:hypothetical protein
MYWLVEYFSNTLYVLSVFVCLFVCLTERDRLCLRFQAAKLQMIGTKMPIRYEPLDKAVHR